MAMLPVSIDGDGYDHYLRDDEDYVQEDLPKEKIKDFDFAEAYMNDQSAADETVDYSEIIKETAFIGEYPFSVIMEAINTQFQDYINIEDKTNYVDVFYEQWQYSMEEAMNDEEHPQEMQTALENIMDEFVAQMIDNFYHRLTITIADIESEDYESDDIEKIIRSLYSFFILKARENFKVAITADINYRTWDDKSTDAEVFRIIEDELTKYSPLITEFGPMEFLKYIHGSDEIYDLFDSGKVNGNFLRKYTPKLYQNEEFKVELINHIIICKEVKEELFYEPGNADVNPN